MSKIKTNLMSLQNDAFFTQNISAIWAGVADKHKESLNGLMKSWFMTFYSSISNYNTVFKYYIINTKHLNYHNITQEQHFFLGCGSGLSGWLALLGDKLTFWPWLCSCLFPLPFANKLLPSILKASATWLPVFALTSLNNSILCLFKNVFTYSYWTASLGTSDLLAKTMISHSGSLYLLTSWIQYLSSSWKLTLSSIA